MRVRLSFLLAALFLVANVLPAAAAPGVTSESILQQLAKVRAATTQYHDVSVAEADGFVQLSPCEATAAGGMGYHYVNLARFGQAWAGAVPNTLRPVALLYAPSETGPRLVGVEYIQPVILADGTVWFGHEAPPAGTALAPAPTLFGRQFDGPMDGHNPMMPAHYDLHVWAWQANPSGMFAQWNPTFSCG
jgi:hypothetical protein